MSDQSCANCLCYRGRGYGPGDLGECRRRAPLPVVLRGGVDNPEEGECWWPLVLADDWCGEYQPPPVKQVRGECPECARLRGVVQSLADRVAAQSELLTRRAEKGGGLTCSG